MQFYECKEILFTLAFNFLFDFPACYFKRLTTIFTLINQIFGIQSVKLRVKRGINQI